MRRFEILEFGLDNLKRVQRDSVAPGPHEVIVRVRAVSLNYRDLLTVQGLYNPKQPLPLVPMSDGAGEVVQVGEAVTRVSVGDRVVGCFFQEWLSRPVPRDVRVLRSTLGGPRDGMLAEEVCLSEEGVAKIPDHLSFEEASTLPCAALTAWSALVSQGQLRPGETVLIQGTGGVAIFALQFTKMVGARAIVTSSSEEKLARVKGLGADELINYRSDPNWGKSAKRLTGGTGVDHVLEIGGAGTLSQSLRAIRPGGQVSLIGVLSGPAADLNITPILMQNVRVQGVLVGPRSELEDMNRAMSLSGMRPAVDRVFDFDDVRAALDHMAAGLHFGKIVVRLGD